MICFIAPIVFSVVAWIAILIIDPAKRYTRYDKEMLREMIDRKQSAFKEAK